MAQENSAPEATAEGQHVTAALPQPPAATGRYRCAWALGTIGAAFVVGVVSLSSAQTVTPTPVAPVAISALTPSGAIAVRGEVSEIYGNKFILKDDTGRALVETGREGETGTLVGRGESVTVQGRFETGFLRARVLTHADGKVVLLGPAGGPPVGSLDWAKEKVGLGRQPDVPALSKAVEQAGYADVRIIGRGPKHLEVAAKGKDGQERQLHVGFDGRIRDVGDRERGRPAG